MPRSKVTANSKFSGATCSKGQEIRSHFSSLNNLHWLTVRKRITFKILLITYKALHGLASTYLSELLNIYKPSRCLRSEISSLLVVPKCRTKLYGERAFAVAAPTLWNKLPSEIKNSTSVALSKRVSEPSFSKINYYYCYVSSYR